MNRPSPTLRNDLTTVARGICMGAADIVPGVSGGTVALILGHYERLVTAISQIDRQALTLLRQRQLKKALEHIDGRFLIALAIGIVIGIGSLASLMHWLFEHRFPETMAVFFGLILASSVLVAKMIPRWDLSAVIAAIFGATVGWTVASLSEVSGTLTIPHIFLCANIAICAMILPGISGAFVLLILGAYHPITGLLKNLLHGEWTAYGLVQLTVFVLGCVTGLALFSRLLKMLLKNFANPTFACLLGLMIGSLRKLWPLQVPTADTAGLEFKERKFEFVSPQEWPDALWPLLGLTLVAIAIVLGLHWLAVLYQQRALAKQATVQTSADPNQ